MYSGTAAPKSLDVKLYVSHGIVHKMGRFPSKQKTSWQRVKEWHISLSLSARNGILTVNISQQIPTASCARKLSPAGCRHPFRSQPASLQLLAARGPADRSLLAQLLAQALQVRGQHFPLHVIQATGTRRQLSFYSPNALSSLLPAWGMSARDQCGMGCGKGYHSLSTAAHAEHRACLPQQLHRHMYLCHTRANALTPAPHLGVPR